MSRGRSRRGLTDAGLIAVVMAIIIAGVVNAGNAAAAEGKVNRVVDGDTVDIVLHGKTERIRLLNVNAPESVDPNKSVECLGPEAAAFLKELLPAGTAVTLAYDDERHDRYGRTLAGIRTKDGALVNSAIARAGLGVPMTVGTNIRFRGEVDAAFAIAEETKGGLFSADAPCTVPARLTAAQKSVSAVPAATTLDTQAQVDAAATQSAASVTATAALVKLLQGTGLFEISNLPMPALNRFLAHAESLHRTAIQARRDTTAVRERLDREHKAAADRKTAVKKAARARAAADENEAAKDREAAKQQQAAARQPALPKRGAGTTNRQDHRSSPAQRPPARHAKQPRKSSSHGGNHGYTGCRAYGPHGTSIDEKGRRFTKIDCP